MSTEPVADAVVLAVEAEPELASLYAIWLGERWTVRTATTGTAALDALDADVDVVLLERRLPDRGGDAVLRAIRDRGFDGPVALVTGVNPGPDIVDLPADDYVLKPVDGVALRGVVETLLRRADHDEAVQELFGLVAKKAALERAGGAAVETAAYDRLVERIEALRAAVDVPAESLGERDRAAVLREFS